MEYNEIKKTNKVLLKGKIIDTLEIAYECFGENFLKTNFHVNAVQAQKIFFL